MFGNTRKDEERERQLQAGFAELCQLPTWLGWTMAENQNGWLERLLLCFDRQCLFCIEPVFVRRPGWTASGLPNE